MTGTPAPARSGPGRIVLVVGPSGAGKDTLLAYAADALGDRSDIVFPRRLVTRASDPGREDHDSISMDEFERMRAGADHALCWEAHGHGYIIPRSVADDVAAGRTVVFNASRSVIADAVERFATVRVAIIKASDKVLAKRLAARGSESREDIRRRLKRAGFSVVGAGDMVTIVNDGSVERAGDELVKAILDD
ncbi:MAG: phosphonate metabolism protein/1,5-bisphosphokinase (PRPP-forming) PhnN [Rhizobiaceae bacterium]